MLNKAHQPSTEATSICSSTFILGNAAKNTSIIASVSLLLPVVTHMYSGTALFYSTVYQETLMKGKFDEFDKSGSNGQIKTNLYKAIAITISASQGRRKQFYNAQASGR